MSTPTPALSNNQVTVSGDAFGKDLANVFYYYGSKIKVLKIENTTVSEKDIQSIKSLSSLANLTFENCPELSGTEIKKVALAKPDCTIQLSACSNFTINGDLPLNVKIQTKKSNDSEPVADEGFVVINPQEIASIPQKTNNQSD